MSVIKHTSILVILLILLGIMYMFHSAFSLPVSAPTPTTPTEGDQIACTMDAMICPDGTAVGRSGPKCEFVCPVMPSTSTTSSPQMVDEKFNIHLNELYVVAGTTIKALSVVQDSRCPSDVQCIQAGKVVVALHISGPSGEVTPELELGTTVSAGTFSITMDDVKPYPDSTHKIVDGDYIFSFTAKSK